MAGAVNITDIQYLTEQTKNRNRRCGGSWPAWSGANVQCPKYFYLRSRPETVQSSWTTLASGIRWRYPTAFSHNSVSISFNGTGLRQLIKRNDTYCYEYDINTPPRWGCRALVSALFTGGNVSLGKFKIDPERSTLISRAETKALDELKLGDVQLGETFATWRDTVRLVSKNSSRIASQWRKAKARYPKAVKKIRENCRGCSASELWLELVYGWIPLMQDIYGSILILSDRTQELGLVVRGRGSASDVQSTPIQVPSLTTDVSPGFRTAAVTDAMETSHRVGVTLWYELTGLNVRSANSLGLINPASLQWDLLPYSFIVDWFLPIGPWLNSFTADAGLEFISGTVSYKREVHGFLQKERAVSPFQWSSIGGSTVTHDTASIEANYFRRGVYTARPVPGLYFKNPISAIHVLNALALLRQAFK